MTRGGIDTGAAKTTSDGSGECGEPSGANQRSKPKLAPAVVE